MSKVIGALLSLVMIGCGQAAPGTEVGSTNGSQGEVVRSNQGATSNGPSSLAADTPSSSVNELAAANDPSRVAVQESVAASAPALAAAPVSSNFRCMPMSASTSQATVAGLAPLNVIRPQPKKPGVVPRLPPRPEVTEAPPGQTAAPDPQPN